MSFRGRPGPWWRQNLSGRDRLRYKLAEIEGPSAGLARGPGCAAYAT